MAAKQLNRRRPFSIGFEPVHPSTLCENLVEIHQAVLRIERPQTEKEPDTAQNNTFWKKFFPSGNDRKYKQIVNYYLNFNESYNADENNVSQLP